MMEVTLQRNVLYQTSQKKDSNGLPKAENLDYRTKNFKEKIPEGGYIELTDSSDEWDEYTIYDKDDNIQVIYTDSKIVSVKTQQ